MRTVLFLILFVSIISGCRELEIIPTTTESYNLKGRVKLLSEKTEKIQRSDDFNYSIDTTTPYCVISNKYFNLNGVLDSIYYFNKDSLFLSKMLNNYHSGKSGVVSTQYDKQGRKKSEMKFISFKDSIVYVEEYEANSNELLSKTWTKKENLKTIWMKSENVKNNINSEWVYERDDTGNETEIKTKFGFDKNQDIRIIKIKYLNWDSKGNWTKRIEYEENNIKVDCLLKTRQIKYYD